MNQHHIEINIELYRIKILLIINKPEFFENYMSSQYDVKFDLNELQKSTAITHIIEHDNESLIVIFFKEFRISSAVDLSLLVHESVHAAAFVFEYIGEKINPNHESFTYLVEHIFYELLLKIKQK